MRIADAKLAQSRSVKEIGHRGPADDSAVWELEDEVRMPWPNVHAIGPLDRIRLGQVVQRRRYGTLVPCSAWGSRSGHGLVGARR